MEGSYAQLKNQGFNCLAFIRITRNIRYIFFKVFRMLSQSQLKILFRSFDAYLDDPQNKEQAEYAQVASTYKRLQEEIETTICVETASNKTPQCGGLFNVLLFFLLIAAFVKCLINLEDDPKLSITLLFVFALMIFLHGMAIGYICFRRAFPSIFNHRVGSTKTLVRLCKWLYKRTWEGMHRRKCYYCRIYDLRQQYLGKRKIRSSLENQQSRQQELNQQWSLRREKSGAIQEEMMTKDALKVKEKKNMTGGSRTQLQLFPVDDNSINDSLLKAE